jgi:hypothetical protein
MARKKPITMKEGPNLETKQSTSKSQTKSKTKNKKTKNTTSSTTKPGQHEPKQPNR